jgi:hypothetical protein
VHFRCHTSWQTAVAVLLQQAFFNIPVPTLSALIPVLEGVDQKVVTAQSMLTNY